MARGVDEDGDDDFAEHLLRAEGGPFLSSGNFQVQPVSR
jgi:hypothetical protein